VPSQETTYACFPFPVSSNFRNYDVVRLDPVVNSPLVLHHIVVFLDTTAPTAGSNCQMSGNVIYAWAVGVAPFQLPDTVGLGVNASYIVLQVHYNNVPVQSGIVDSSGLKIYFAPRRTNQAGLIWLGTETISIPPQNPNVTIWSACVLPKTFPEVNVFADFKHAHLLGRHIWSYHTRNATFVPAAPSTQKYAQLEYVNGDSSSVYSFNRQEFVQISPWLNVSGATNDGFVTYCNYDSTGVSTTTVFGESTSFEMCFHFLMYYPLATATSSFQCFTATGNGTFILP